MTSANTTQQIHKFLVSRVGMMLEELRMKSGLDIWYNNRVIEHISHEIESYMSLDQISDVSEEIEI